MAKRTKNKVPAAILKRLARARGWVCDMDGTLVLGDRHNKGLRPLPRAIEFIDWLKRRELPFVLFTNGTTRTPRQYAETLQDIGFDLGERHLMTPASSAVDVFLRKGYRRVMVLGGDGLKLPLAAAGIEPIAPAGKPAVEAVLVGWFREFTVNEIEAAVFAIWSGAQLYSCSQSLFFASADGKTLGTSRLISAAISDLTGERIRIVGKPSIDALRSAARRLCVKTSDLAVMGDDPSLEIAMAHRGRSFAVAVHSGIGDRREFRKLPAAQRPHIAVENVAELLDLCRKLE
jgi:HAD superfamily hydrolase (TIGR01450 family)